MDREKIFYSEAAYAVGLVLLAVGTALMERADFGMSMVVAPAYVLYRKTVLALPWFTFGMAEYVLQAVLLLITACCTKQIKRSYFFSFLTALLYGCILDTVLPLAEFLPSGIPVLRLLYFVTGMMICSLGIAFLFRTYFAPEAYELIVKEIAETKQKEISVVKTVYDCLSCGMSVLLSFAFFGFGTFVGVKAGTVVCALINGWMIGKADGWMKRSFVMKDASALRRYFEG